MSKPLFDTLSDNLQFELSNQLSEAALSVYNALAPDINAIYKVASASPEISNRDLAIIRQILDFHKKFVGESVNSVHEIKRNQECWSVFKQANLRCGQQNENFESLDIDTMITLNLIQKDIEQAFWKHSESENFEFAWGGEGENTLIPIAGFSSGPGTCCGTQGVSLLEKYRGVWHATTDLGKKYLQVLRKISKPIHDLPKFVVKIKSVIKATFVLKRYDISRLIAPQLNGDILLQYPMESCLCHMLKYFGIDLVTQQGINRELARKGSLFDNNDIFEHSLRRRRFRPCTIDLSSASDLIGTILVKFSFPIPVFNYMEMARCDTMKAVFYQGDKGETVRLNMMATMGNAYCFPMQTIWFCAAVRAIYFRLGLPLEIDGTPTYGVYGDDIILDITAYDYMIKFLQNLEMQPNPKKCFSHGLFRESCGGDYFNGYDIRPVFIEELSDDCHLYSAINRLVDWSAQHSVSLTHTIGLLMSKLSVKTIVPLNCGDHQGLRVPECYIPILPEHWKRNFWCVASVDKSFYLHIRWTERYPYVPCVVMPPSLSTVNRGRTLMSEYRYLELDRASAKKIVGLDMTGDSMLPFLRGGISQLVKIDCLAEVVSRDREDECGVEGLYKSVPNWDRSENDFSPSYIKYMGNTLLHLTYVLARVVRSAEVFAREENRKLV